MNWSGVWSVLKEAGEKWMENKAPRMGAALAFYTLLSLSPLALLAVSIAGLTLGEEAASGQLVTELRGLVGEEGAKTIEGVVANANRPQAGSLAAILSFGMLLFGASGVFGELQDSMNTVWGVRPKATAGWWAFLKARFLSFGMVFGIGFLLLVSMVLSAVLAYVGKFLDGYVPAGALEAGHSAASLLLITVLFGAIYKVLPDAQVRWRDVLVGSAVTAILFVLGRYLIGLYIGRSSVGSAYGAAGSLVVLLIWVYYSAQILLFGAELTKAYSVHQGQPVVPEPGAERVELREVQVSS